jgi:hypothetical protein
MKKSASNGGYYATTINPGSERYLQSLEDEEEKITALNAFRQILHEYSPFKSQPVDCVLWVKQDAVSPNDYNPNNVAPPEKRLLLTSLETDGFTQPIVVSNRIRSAIPLSTVFTVMSWPAAKRR